MDNANPKVKITYISNINFHFLGNRWIYRLFNSSRLLTTWNLQGSSDIVGPRSSRYNHWESVQVCKNSRNHWESVQRQNTDKTRNRAQYGKKAPAYRLLKYNKRVTCNMRVCVGIFSPVFQEKNALFIIRIPDRWQIKG